jgi:hypothetical protein
MSRFRMVGRRRAIAPQVRSTPAPLTARAAKLAAVLTEGLQTEVVVQHIDDDLVFMINDRDGRYLSNDRGLEGAELQPIFVAFVPADEEKIISTHFESVTGTTVLYSGNGGAMQPEEAGLRLVRHYLPAVDPSVPVVTWPSR